MKREIRLAERIYVKSQIINSKSNTNSIWKVINRCLPKKSLRLPQFNDSHENMANSFNKYFSSVGSLTALKAGQLAKDQNWTLDSNAYETSNVSTLGEQFEFQPVSESDVANIILNLPSNKGVLLKAGPRPATAQRPDGPAARRPGGPAARRLRGPVAQS